MMLGLSPEAFTLLHVIISLIAIVSGIIVVGGMMGSRRLPGWTALFLLTTVLTSVTGLMFPGTTLTPARIFAIISLVVLLPTLVALYGFRLRGAWRWIYAGGAVIALYLNVFVLIAQAFAKIPVLQPLAPTQSEPPFLTAEIFVMAIFILLLVLAIKKFHPEHAAA
jgi:F0F1-type ATP synthase assembly protein I